MPDSTDDVGREAPVSIADVPLDVVEDAVFEIRQRAEFVGWADYEREQQYYALADQLLDAKREWPVGVGAVLYGPDGNEEFRDLWHVTDRFASVDGDRKLVTLWDGTHTSRRYERAEDLLADYTPAGWSWPTGQKPLYHLTRECGADDASDLMTDGGQPAEGGRATPQNAADEAELADEKPKKTCDYRGVGHKPCGNEAVTAVFSRRSGRVNDHGVHVSTEVEVLFACEEHAHRGNDVPDREARVRSRSPPTEGSEDE